MLVALNPEGDEIAEYVRILDTGSVRAYLCSHRALLVARNTASERVSLVNYFVEVENLTFTGTICDVDSGFVLQLQQLIEVT